MMELVAVELVMMVVVNMGGRVCCRWLYRPNHHHHHQ
jgi:hypothetical protein